MLGWRLYIWLVMRRGTLQTLPSTAIEGRLFGEE